MRNLPGLPLTSRYALSVVVELARLPPGEKAPTQRLSERTGVPAPFLAKVLGQLARAGLVSGIKGHRGGYELARDPASICLGEVLDALSENGAEPRECVMGDRRCGEQAPCSLHDRWLIATAPMAQLLESVTVAVLAAPNAPTALGPRVGGTAPEDPHPVNIGRQARRRG